MSMLTEKIAQWKKDGKSWFKKNETKIIFAVALLVVSGLSFEVGVLTSKQGNDHTLVIEKPTQSIAKARENTLALDGGTVAGAETKTMENGKQKMENEEKTTPTPKIDCLFVGSKNSTKYHSPSCSYAKKIKPENRVCFKSKEEAEGRGYIAGCIK